VAGESTYSVDESTCVAGESTQVLGPDYLVYIVCAMLLHLRRRIVHRASCRDLAGWIMHSPVPDFALKG
jgi:hypothetical protein